MASFLDGTRTVRMLLVCAAAVAMALPAAALAAGGSRITISSPHKARVGRPFTFAVRVSSGSAGNAAAVFLNSGLKCPRTVRKELATRFASTGYRRSVGKERFTQRFTVTPRAPGPHFICAYLFRNNASEKTIARALSRYVTAA